MPILRLAGKAPYRCRPVNSALGVTSTMTIVLRVLVNGEEFVLAGEESMGVLSAHVTAVGKLGPKAEGSGGRRGADSNIDLGVGGMTSRGDKRKDEHLRWGPRLPLEPGDTVTIEVLDSNDFQNPTSRYKTDTSSSYGFAARRRWEEAKSLYFRLRSRFGSRSEREAARFRRHVIKGMRSKRDA